jgi:hypothetical protein
LTLLLIFLIVIGVVVGVYSRSQGATEAAAMLTSFVFVLAVYGLANLIGAIL